MKKHTEEVAAQCPFCGVESVGKEAMWNHLEEHHKKKNIPVTEMKSSQQLAKEYRGMVFEWFREGGIDEGVLRLRFEGWIRDIQIDAVMAAAAQCVRCGDTFERVNALALNIQKGKYPKPLI